MLARHHLEMLQSHYSHYLDGSGPGKVHIGMGLALVEKGTNTALDILEAVIDAPEYQAVLVDLERKREDVASIQAVKKAADISDRAKKKKMQESKGKEQDSAPMGEAAGEQGKKPMPFYGQEQTLEVVVDPLKIANE